MTLEEFNTGFNYLVGHFPNTKNLKSVSYAYYEDLKDTLTGEEFVFAIKKIVRSGKSEFMPKVSEIIGAVKGNIDIENQLLQAKKLLKTAIGRCGSTGMVAFEDKGLHAVIDFMGWNRLCMMSVEEFDNFINFQFDGIYKGFLENAYETSDYFTGTNKLFGQTEPRMMTYESIGVRNTGNMNFIPLDYKPVKRLAEVENIKKKMLIGG